MCNNHFILSCIEGFNLLICNNHFSLSCIEGFNLLCNDHPSLTCGPETADLSSTLLLSSQTCELWFEGFAMVCYSNLSILLCSAMLFYNFLIYTTIQSMNANVKNIPSPVSSFVCLFSVLKNYHFNPQVIIGCLGNIGNLISIVVLSTSEMRNSFNLLLIFLAVRKQSDDIPEFIQGIQTLDFQCFSKSMMLI